MSNYRRPQHLRLRPMTRRYLMPTTEEAGDRYVPRPPDADDGPLEFGVTIPSVAMTAGEGMAVYGDHQDRLWLWRDRHPESAVVHDGVKSTEAGVDVNWITTDEEPTTDEEGGDNGRQ